MLALSYTSEPGKEPRLQITELPTPEPGEGELLVDVRATALNRADLLQVRGLYPPPAGESSVPGLECAGRVAKVGPGASRFGVGDRVMALLGGGGHATQVVLPECQAMLVPDGLSWPEAAALPEAALTSWTNLVVEGQLQRGQTCLISAAASGIGTFAVQLSRELGARALVAGRDLERLAQLEPLGSAGAVLLGDGLADAVKELNGGQGVDLVMDLVGGDSFAHLLDALEPRGRMVLVGLMAGPRCQIDLSAIMRKRLRIVGSVLRSRSRAEKAGLVAGFMEFARERLDSGALRPVVASVQPFEQLPAAYLQMAEGGHFGKLVLEMGSGS